MWVFLSPSYLVSAASQPWGLTDRDCNPLPEIEPRSSRLRSNIRNTCTVKSRIKYKIKMKWLLVMLPTCNISGRDHRTQEGSGISTADLEQWGAHPGAGEHSTEGQSERIAGSCMSLEYTHNLEMGVKEIGNEEMCPGLYLHRTVPLTRIFGLWFVTGTEQIKLLVMHFSCGTEVLPFCPFKFT